MENSACTAKFLVWISALRVITTGTQAEIDVKKVFTLFYSIQKLRQKSFNFKICFVCFYEKCWF